ncbi:MAG: ChbG/HpnK family deacetylase [Actinomycetota bacterium]|nr:ChbG/HpnK family deacetylase [Actinomycetota bacterium]
MEVPAGGEGRLLIITADDYGYWPSYNEGILGLLEAGALDAVSAMVDREHCDPEPLLESGVEIGLHIEFEGRWGPRSGAPARSSLRVQLDRFVDLFQRWPAFLNGHHHCHARPELATPVLQIAEQIGVPVRSVSRDHRQWLRERGIATNDVLVGRTRSSEPAEPAELRALEPGVTEWFAHPGYPDAESGSEYDLARREDLDTLLRARVRARFDKPLWGDARRTTYSEAFRYPGGPLERATAQRPVLPGEEQGPG